MEPISQLRKALGGLFPRGSGPGEGGCIQNGIERSDYFLKFTIPPHLMPDNQFAGQAATLRVHRVKPVYAHAGCRAKNAIVLVHGKTVGGSVSFDLQNVGVGSAALSLQEALAWAGIDTFAPDLLGYGQSSRLSLDVAANASLPGYEPNGTCHYIGCDTTRNANVFPLDQQRTKLWTNPLHGAYQAHESHTYFGNTDLWARDIRQVIEDARLKTGLNKVSLLGYSFGGPRVGRTLSLLADKAAQSIDRVIFMSSLFDIPATSDEPSTSFPLAVASKAGWDNPSPYRVSDATQAAFAQQAQADDPIGAKWGGTPSMPKGVIRFPTFTNTGWNKKVAAAISIPTLVLHGMDDKSVAPANALDIYKALTVPKKVLVELSCASHMMHYEVAPGRPGPHKDVADAIIEWVQKCTFDGDHKGHFTIDCAGVRRWVVEGVAQGPVVVQGSH